MKKIFLIFFVVVSLFGIDIKNLIGEEKYKTYHQLLLPILDKDIPIKQTLKYLQDNGLLQLFFDKPKFIHPSFTFINNNPIFNTKTLYDTLNNIGYYYIYPIDIKKDKFFKITLELKTTHYINPLNIVNELEKRGCQVIDINKTTSYNYKIDCENERLNTFILKKRYYHLKDAKNLYWIDKSNFKKVKIVTSRYDKWYPYVVLYDKNLNVLDIKTYNTHKRILYLNLPFNCRYIKITDYFSPENIKRGIWLKGIE